jgi:hypothetical protein
MIDNGFVSLRRRHASATAAIFAARNDSPTISISIGYPTGAFLRDNPDLSVATSSGIRRSAGSIRTFLVPNTFLNKPMMFNLDT